MAIYMKGNGLTDWCPDCVEKREGKSSINPGSRNAERQFAGTVNSTARMLAMLETEKVTEDNFYEGLSKNAQHIGISEEELLDLAAQKLAQKENEA